MSLITKKADLTEVCDSIDKAGRFALDLEFIPERTYAAELCLVQIATDEEVFLVDPIAIPDLTQIWQRVADPKILKVLHAAEQDLDLAFTASGLVPQNLFDTQIAAGFIGFGYPVGYGKLLQQLLNITISKTESYTDWTHRPLTKQQIEYAIDDVRHLLPIYEKLVKQLTELKRFDWVMEECRKYCDESYFLKDRTNDFFRIKGANTLNRRGLAVLRELSDWRHSEAYRVNKPLKSILQDGILLEFARRPPKELSDIQRIRGVRPDQARQYGNGLLQAVKAGLEVADEDLPRWPAARIPTRREVLMADVLYTVLRVLCFDLDIAPELVATRSILEGLVRRHFEGSGEGSQLPIAQGWRYDIAGRTMERLLHGGSLSMQFREDDHPVRMELDGQTVQN